MRLRLTHLPELRIDLDPGWYELPSHLPIEEVRRLIDLLADAVAGIESVVECEWSQLDMLATGPTALVFVRVPEVVAHESIEERLKSLEVRLGLYLHVGVGRWP